jgi:SHS family lactate transporter-like MFS transporter
MASPDPGSPWWKEPTRAQWLTFAAAWSGWVLDAFDFTIFLLVMPSLAQHFHVPLTATAGTITLTLLMRLIGGVFAGALADRYGRKLPLILSVAWFALCDGAIAFAPSFAWVIALRVLFGLGMGAQWTAGTTLAMESWPERSRGIASGILQGSWAVGYLAATAVTRFVMVHSHHGWRALFLVAALPALAVLPLQLSVSESQAWRATIGKALGTMAALRRPGMARRLAWASASMSLGLAAYYAFTGLYSSLLQTELGKSIPDAMTMIALFNVAMLVGAVGFGMVAKRRGIVAAVVAPALLMIPFLPLYVGAVPELLWLGALAGGAIGVGWSGTVPVYLTALFPAEVRGKAIGIVYHVGAFVAALVPPAITALADMLRVHHEVHAPLGWSIATVAGACEIGLALLLLLQPKEMMGGEATTGAGAAEAASVDGALPSAVHM